VKLLVVGEGSTEYGNGDEDGVAQTMLRRLLGGEDPRELRLDVAPYGAVLPAEPRGAAFATDEARRAAWYAAEALRRGCHALVLLRDADRQVHARRAALRDGVSSAGVSSVIGIPIETIEAWLLADPDAFVRAFGVGHKQVVDDPERLWGARSDAASNHPKNVWGRACRDIERDPRVDSAVRVAREIDLNLLARACPEGFGRFAAELVQAIPRFECVVAADRNRGIGKDNELPWPRLRSDVEHFRMTTTASRDGMRNAVLMGRKTWESIPVRFRPLPDRLNIVISRNEHAVYDGAVRAESLDHALVIAGRDSTVDKVFVVGGAQVYEKAIAHFLCRGVYYTRIDFEFDCDATFPPLEPRMRVDEGWVRRQFEESGFAYAIEHWVRA
jgi:dihydrofolate reductase